MQTFLSGNDKIFCLPGEAISWLDHDIFAVDDYMRSHLTDAHRLKMILMPLQMKEKAHWGLVVVDLENAMIWLDDGRK